MPYRQTIAAAYDAGVEEEYLRLTENPLSEAEFQLIVELINDYIPDGSTVIDVGSGPGRYAEYLLKGNSHAYSFSGVRCAPVSLLAGAGKKSNA